MTKLKTTIHIYQNNDIEYYNNNFVISSDILDILDYNDIFLLHNWEGLQPLIKKNPWLNLNFKME